MHAHVPQAGGKKAAPPTTAPVAKLSPFHEAEAPRLEQEADQAAALAMGRAAGGAAAPVVPPTPPRERTGLQRARDGDPSPLSTLVDGVRSVVAAAPSALGLSAIIVEDDVTPQPGQIGRSAFVARARAAIGAAADAELAETGRSSADCPYIQRWVSYFGGQNALAVERAAFLYGRAAERTPDALVAALAGRVREGVRTWRATGEVPAAAGGEPSAGPGGVMPKSDGSGAPVSPRSDHPEAVRRRLGPGHAMDPGVRHRMERGFGASFAGVRLHEDAEAGRIAAEQRARALTVGQDIVYSARADRPGTSAGDLLLAHELAHTLQQRGGTAVADRAADESSADQAAVQVLMGEQAAVAPQGGLRLRGCSDDPPARRQTLVEELGEIDSGAELAERLNGLNASRWAEVRRAAPTGGLLADGIAWETAIRASSWARLSALAQGEGVGGFVEFYGPVIVGRIQRGATPIRIDATDPAFAEWTRNTLESLGSNPAGFRLLCELLVTGQPIRFEASTTGSERRPLPGIADDVGSLVDETPDIGELANKRWRRGTPTGSIIRLDVAQLENMTTVGGTTAAPSLVPADIEASVGHELIHALHVARGDAIPNPTLGGLPFFGFRNPVLGDVDSMSEHQVISGRTTFPIGQGPVTWPTTNDLTENMLRAERGLPDRLSHFGVPTQQVVATPAALTPAQLVARYRKTDGSAISAPLLAYLTGVVGPLAALTGTGGLTRLPLPTPDLLSLRLRVEVRNEALADEAELLELR